MLALLALGSVEVRAAVPFPAETDWVPFTLGGAPVTDVAADLAVTLPAPPDPDPSLDLLGIAGEPVLSWWVEADTLFLRMRVEDNADTVDGGWAFLLDTDADPATWERTLGVEGPTHEVLGFVNSTGAAGTWAQDRATTSVAGYGQDSTGETDAPFVLGKYYLQVQLPLATLATDFGIDATTTFRVAGVTTQLWRFGLEDVAGCDGTLAVCDDLTAVSSDPVTLDGDGDGLPTPLESLLGTDPDDADSDDDGATDDAEVGDGRSDPLVCDTDGDGLPDGLERGNDAPSADTDLAVGCFAADADPGTVTRPDLADTDGGGLADGAEDRDGDGAQGTWETDPLDPADDVDSDGDGIPDALDDRAGGGADEDSDGDSIDDAVEGLVDTDGDGTPDFADEDSDGDGIDDAIEGAVDTDGDGVPDFRDDDSDGDGIPDAVEGVEDTDGDGVRDSLDPDSDGDGIPDLIEGAGDTDGDGVPDFRDPDSDGDGVPDDLEGAEDSDGDGVPDFQDEDSDDDGVPDGEEGLYDEGELVDSDGDGNPDLTDTDSDNDGIPDGEEGDGDEDCDGVPDRVDTDREDSFCDTATVPTVDTDARPPPPTDPLGAPGQFTGGACDVAGGVGTAPALVVLAALALLRRRRAAVAGAALPSVAAAQEVDAERLALSVDGGALLKVEDVAPTGPAGVSVFVDHADDPLVFRPVVGDPVDVLGAVTTARATVFSSVGPFRIGGEVPLHLYAAGTDLEGPTHLGDLRLSSRLTLVRPAPFGVGVYLDAGLPTGAGGSWVGAGALTAHTGAIATIDRDRLLVSATTGVRTGTGQSLGGLDVSPAITFGLGAAVSVVEDTWLAVELDGDAWLGNSGQAGDVPAELLVSGRRTVRDVDVVLGGGPGLTRGVGSPDFRLLLGVRWSPQPAAPVVAEPEPPAPAPLPAPPAVAPSTGHVVVRAIDPTGRPFPAAAIRFVGSAEEPLATGPDGILEVDRPPGDVEITAAADGWAAKGRTVSVRVGDTEDVTVMLYPLEARIAPEVGQILLVDKVFFEVDRAELKLESLATLDALVKLLAAHPEVKRVRIEGHTDATGTDEHNLELSQQRAEAVRTYLVSQGVVADRLETKGMGEGHPIQPGDSEEVYATNRRVEFHLVDQPAP
jgi:outer membrane protein OmpA-like peptidoglycan-associated protein